MTSTVGRLVVDVLTNQSGGSVALGDVVYVDTAHDTAFTTGTTSAYTGMVGVVIEANGIASLASGRVQFSGHCAQVNLNASGTRGHFVKTFTVAKQATDAGASRVVGVFGQILVTGTTPPVELFGFPDGSTGAAGSPGTPALTLSTTNSTGAAATLVATDATIAAFDATVPVTQAIADAAATGSAGFAARRDHKHGMPAQTAIFPNEYELFLTSDTAITTANTAQDILSLTLPVGSWEIRADAEITSANAGQTQLTIAIFDGTSIVANAQVVQQSGIGGISQHASCVARTTLAGSTVVKLQAFSVRGSSDSTVKKTATSNGTANKATSLHAIAINPI